MELRIFDISHGFCAYLVADNGNVMLFDCGHNENTGFRPSHYLRNQCSEIEHLIIQNFDQDHISDLPNLAAAIPIRCFIRNQSISADALAQIKRRSGPLTNAMQRLLDLHREYVHFDDSPPDFAGIEFVTFHNDYPTFTDTNNLSLVSFLHYDGMGIVFPGDLEREGWEALLMNSAFRAHLQRVNIFIASHHGRENGYCNEVFNYCDPEIVIISDEAIQYDTQDMTDTYANHASGILWNGGPDKRFVLTTRSDGMITIRKQIGQGCNVSVG